MKKKILIGLFIIGMSSSTSFCIIKPMDQQDDAYSYVLQGIDQVQKDFLGISALYSMPYGSALHNLKASQEETEQPILLNQLSLFNPTSTSSMQMGAKNISLHQKITSETTDELSELPVQSKSSSFNAPAALIQGVQNSQSPVADSPSQQLATDPFKITDSSERNTADSATQLAVGHFKANDLFDQNIGNIGPQLNFSSLQLMADFSNVTDFSDRATGEMQYQFVGLRKQLIADSFEVHNFSGHSKLGTRQQIASSISWSSSPYSPSLLPIKNNLERVNKEERLNFDNVIEQMQIKADRNGFGLRSTSIVLQSKNDRDHEISLGLMGTIFGKEAQKFADRWAKLREVSEANSSAPVSGKGNIFKNIDVSTPKVSHAKKPVSFRARALSMLNKVTNPISSSNFINQLKQVKLNKVALNEETNNITNYPNLKDDLLKELKNGKSLNRVDVTATKSTFKAALLSIEDLEVKLANTKDVFFKKLIKRQINEMRAEAIIPKVENNPHAIKDSSLNPLILLPAVDSDEKKDIVPFESLPGHTKSSSTQKKDEVFQLEGFFFNASVNV